MEWLKLDLRWVRSPEFIGSDPVGRATWLSLMAFCADKENGGRIQDCERWPDRMWQQMCGVTLDETRQESDLFTWDGDDLLVAFYPTKTEELVQSRRDAGKAGAEARWQKKDLPLAKQDCANADQNRTEERRKEKSRPEEEPKASATGCKGLDWGEAMAWMDLVNGGIPDRHRAESLTREFMDEMEQSKWVVVGKEVSNPLGLLITRLKNDGAYHPKSKG
jgi:hypothetical protein